MDGFLAYVGDDVVGNDHVAGSAYCDSPERPCCGCSGDGDVGGVLDGDAGAAVVGIGGERGDTVCGAADG